MGILLTKYLGRYLGYEIIHHGSNKKLHEKILQKLNGRLEGWKVKCVSRAGRITLAKSVLNNILIFFMQLEKLPSRIHKEINRLVRRCVLGDSPAGKRVHLVYWETLCKPKEMGGVG